MRPPSDLLLDNPLWQTALSLWSNDAIAEACITLQSHGVSVSRLLTAIWLTRQGVEWNGDEDEAVLAWRAHYTDTLRQLRQTLAKGTPADAFRESLKASELKAERIELAWIYQTRRQDCHNVSGFSGYNEDLLIRNLRAASPDREHSTAFEADMTQLINALRAARNIADATHSQGSLS